MSIRPLGALGAAALMIAACNPQTAEPTPEAPSAPAPQTAAPPATVTPTAANGACSAANLRLSSEGGDAGMGHRITIVGVTNTGAAACILNGWPTVAVLGADGVTPKQANGGYLRSGQTPAPVQLAAGGKAFFDIAWTVIPHEGEGETTCPNATGIRVTLPGGDAAQTLTQDFTPCGGSIDVTPFRAEAEPAV